MENEPLISSTQESLEVFLKENPTAHQCNLRNIQYKNAPENQVNTETFITKNPTPRECIRFNECAPIESHVKAKNFLGANPTQRIDIQLKPLTLASESTTEAHFESLSPSFDPSRCCPMDG